MGIENVPAALLSKKQLHSVRTSTGTVNIWDGSIRSGKTIASLLRWLIFCASAPTGGALVVIARTRESAARNVFGPLMDPSLFGSIAHQVHYTPGAPTATILGRTVHVIGASDAKSEKVLRGLTVAGAYVDEITVIPEEFFVQLLGRMSVVGAALFGTTNPDNPAHWFNRKFLLRVKSGLLPGWRYFHFVMEDNPTLTRQYIDRVSREFTGLWYRRFILGEWVAAEGAIYDMWDPAKHVIRWDDMPPMRRILGVGIDYGTQHATSAIMLGLGYDRHLYLMDELRLDSAQAQQRYTDSEQSRLIKAWLPQPHQPPLNEAHMRPEWVIADQAGASLREELARDHPGQPSLSTSAADKDVEYGIRIMASLLGDTIDGVPILRVSDRCHGFINEAPGYSWDPKAAERGDEKPIKVADDSLDAGRYVTVTLESQWRPEIRTLQPAF